MQIRDWVTEDICPLKTCSSNTQSFSLDDPG